MGTAILLELKNWTPTWRTLFRPSFLSLCLYLNKMPKCDHCDYSFAVKTHARDRHIAVVCYGESMALYPCFGFLFLCVLTWLSFVGLTINKDEKGFTCPICHKVSRQHDHSAVILNNIVKMYPLMRRNTPTSSPAVALGCFLIINTVWTKKRQMETQISIQLVMMAISIKPMILVTRYFSRTRNNHNI